MTERPTPKAHKHTTSKQTSLSTKDYLLKDSTSSLSVEHAFNGQNNMNIKYQK